MPDQKLTQLPALAALSADDIFYVVDDPAGAANSRQIAASVFDARYLQAANNLSDLTNVVVARASLGLGTLAVINSPLPIINGGSGQATQQTAIDALTNVAAATNEHVLTKDTATGNAIFKAGAAALPVVDETAIVYETGVPANTLTFDVTAYTAARVVSWPDAAMTVAGLQVANIFTVGQTFQTATPITLSTDNSTITGSKSVTLQQTGDTFGTTQLKIQNRAGAAGAIFENVALDLVDFGFKPLTSPQGNLRMEGRTAFQIGAGNTKGELQVLLESLVGNGKFVAGFGDSQTVLQSPTALTNTVKNVLQVSHITTGVVANGFGVGIQALLESSTTEKQLAGRLTWEWATATHATRKALGKLTAFDAATEREAMQWGVDGSNPTLGFLGATRIARPASYTLASTATRTMPTPEAAFTGIDNAQVGAVYAQVADLLTLQTRLNNVEGVLRQVIIDLASTSGFGLLVAA